MCRKTLFMTAYARDRSSWGYGGRKIDRQTGLRRIVWSTRSRKLTGLLLPRRGCRPAPQPSSVAAHEIVPRYIRLPWASRQGTKAGRGVGNRRVTVTVMLPSTDPFAALGDENRRTILRL